LQAAADQLDPDQRSLLERTASRIESFARAQLACLKPLTCAVPGGTAGHTLEPVERVGCYAPAGRSPRQS
jgi:histidinol dehydrogenase